jgi:hypothetical protein
MLAAYPWIAAKRCELLAVRNWKRRYALVPGFRYFGRPGRWMRCNRRNVAIGRSSEVAGATGMSVATATGIFQLKI